MNDPAWDLADLSVEADLDGESERGLLDAYGGDDPQLMHRVALLKPVADLLWSTWSLAERAAGSTADDFARESERRLARAERSLAALRIEGSA